MRTIEKILVNKNKSCKPIWFMRQAGRHLPEFRKIRSKNKNFIKLCLNAKLSAKITLQPVNRYNLDAAIIFSDILMIPYALGQDVKFKKKEGPVLNNFDEKKFFKYKKKDFLKELTPTYKCINIVRKKLNKNKTLISFVGAPWTLIIYMMGLKKNKKQLSQPKTIQIKMIKRVINKLTDYICLHIEKQKKAGADIVQVFDSWAGLLPSKLLNDFCYKPNLRIVKFCKKNKIPVICFPKGIKKKYLNFNQFVRPNGLNLDSDVDPKWAKKNLKNVTLQGGINPLILLKSERKIYKEAKKYLDIFKNVPYIFNLGHGLVPSTDPNKLKKLVEFVRHY